MRKCVLEGPSRKATGVAWLLARRTTAGVVFVKDALVTRHISHYLVDRMTCHILPRAKQKDGLALTDMQRACWETASGKVTGASSAPSRPAGQ